MNSGRRQGFWRLRPLAGFAAAFCLLAGVWLAFGWLPAAVLFLISGPAMVLVRPRTLRFALAGAACGAVWVTLWWAVTLAPISHLADRGGFYTVEITDYPESKVSYGTVSGSMQYNGRSYGVWVQLADGSPDLKPGDTLRIEGNLTCRGIRNNPDAADGLWLRLEQTGECRVTPGTPRTVGQKLRTWNKTLADRIDQLLDDPAAGLLQALLTGDRSGISARTNAELSRAGLSHIAAVSGLHLSVLAGLLTRFLGQRYGRMLAIPLLVMFTAFTGFSPSALRALTLWCFLFAAWSLRRRSDPMTALLTALLLQVVFNPCALLSVSLQLSFASVCGLVLVGPACAELLPQRKRWSRRTALSNLVLLIGDGLLTTCCATVFTVPLLLWYFGSFSLAAPVANLLTLWAVAPAMVLGGGALLISGLSVSAGAALMIPARLLLQWLLEVAHTVSLLPGVALSADFPVVWLTAGAIVMLGICGLRGSFRNTAGMISGTLAVVLLILSGHRSAQTDLVILESRRGAAGVMAVTGQGSYILDPGPSLAGSHGEWLAEELWKRGVASPDYLVATGTRASKAGSVPDLCDLTDPAVIAGPQDLYLHFDTAPRNAYLLPHELLELPGGVLHLLPGGREDSCGWLLEQSGLRILSVCDVQPRPFLVLNGDADLSCDLLLLNDAFLQAPDSLGILLEWADPKTVVLAADAYTDDSSLRRLWQGELRILEDRQQYILTRWRE